MLLIMGIQLHFSGIIGDGYTSNEASPIHTYLETADYNVFLSIELSNGNVYDTIINLSCNFVIYVVMMMMNQLVRLQIGFHFLFSSCSQASIFLENILGYNLEDDMIGLDLYQLYGGPEGIRIGDYCGCTCFSTILEKAKEILHI